MLIDTADRPVSRLSIRVRVPENQESYGNNS
jgi:hypothetical protein